MLVHKEVRKIAKGIAGAAYEELAKQDIFHQSYPNQKYFIERHWKNFIPQARQSLIELMAGDYPEIMKDEILEIFLQDKTLQAVDNLKIQGSA